jgi:hypothetical protein
MSRLSPNTFALSLLPALVVPLALSLAWGKPHRTQTQAKPESLILYQTPSSALDPLRVRQLTLLLREINASEHQPTRPRMPDAMHLNLSAEYRVIVRETTPQALRRSGLPADVR